MLRSFKSSQVSNMILCSFLGHFKLIIWSQTLNNADSAMFQKWELKTLLFLLFLMLLVAGSHWQLVQIFQKWSKLHVSALPVFKCFISSLENPIFIFFFPQSEIAKFNFPFCIESRTSMLHCGSLNTKIKH